MLHFLARLLAFSLLAGSIGIGWHPAQEEIESPPGCQMVFAATTRGGGSTPPHVSGSCNIWGRPTTGEVEVVRIIDGDTIEIAGGERVRYIGIDTPELNPEPEPYAIEATRFNANLIQGKKVLLVKDISNRDRFGRLLRYVYADGILVNAELVREGYATAKAFPPDVVHANCFIPLQSEAEEAGRGIWSDARLES